MAIYDKCQMATSVIVSLWVIYALMDPDELQDTG